MLVATTFPLLDVRSFVTGNPRRAGSPAWPTPRADRREFIRYYGAVKERQRADSLKEWTGEKFYCDATGAIRFSDDFGDGSAFGDSCTRYCAFRRFYSDGAISHFDVGFGYRRFKRHLTADEALQIVRASVELPIHVCGIGKTATPLISADRALARQYLRATTTREATSSEPWWVTAGAPMVVVEYHKDLEVAELPQGARRIDSLATVGVELAHCRIELNGRRFGVWFLGRNAESSLDALRRLRVTLLRVHAERESVKELLRLLGTRRLQIKRNDEDPFDPAELLQRHLMDVVGRLDGETQDGLPQAEIIAAAQTFEDIVNEGEREMLLKQLAPLRRNLFHNVRRFTERATEISANVVVLNQDGTLQITAEQNERKTVTNQSINFGDNAHVVGDITQTAAQKIQGSFNRVKNASTSDELRAQLTELTKVVAAMLEKLPPEKQEEQARNVETLTAEALSPKPRKEWYELSAKGLIEAAETVGKIATPVITTVKAILALLV